MFTGIIEETGMLLSLNRTSRSCILKIGAKTVLQGCREGDSIAVNGICLTVTSFTGSFFTADVMPETLDRSCLGGLIRGNKVNLERAMPADGRFGGHMVSGHIDGTGIVTGIRRDDNAVWYTVDTAPAILRYIVEKGSVSIDGISLTVARVTGRNFCVSVIPHTADHTNLSGRRIGDTVNLENDCIGKYLEKLLLSGENCSRRTAISNGSPPHRPPAPHALSLSHRPPAPHAPAHTPHAPHALSPSVPMTEAFLRQHGF